MSNVAEFFVNFSFIISVLCMVLSNILIIASPDILSINGAPNLISFCSFGFKTVCSFGEIKRDLFKMLKQQSHVYMTPSNSNAFLIPKTKSTFS